MRASSFLPLASAASATGGGVCNPHTAPFPLIHPPVDGGDPFKNDGAAYNPHAAPSFNFVYPPLLGGFSFTVVSDDGDGVYSTLRPLLLILSPPLVWRATVDCSLFGSCRATAYWAGCIR